MIVSHWFYQTDKIEDNTIVSYDIRLKCIRNNSRKIGYQIMMKSDFSEYLSYDAIYNYPINPSSTFEFEDFKEEIKIAIDEYQRELYNRTKIFFLFPPIDLQSLKVLYEELMNK